MKTKNKTLALMEIAIVLCSLFLVVIPAISAQEQNQEMQKLSASRVTTASEDDYVLDIYGNANEDDTIDMGDVVYTKLAIFGKKPKTELCDAKYDGRINVLDIIQTKLIILGKEKELTVVDCIERFVTAKKPVNRVISLEQITTEVINAIGAKDKVVSCKVWGGEVFLPELSKLPSVGSASKPDYEAILELEPDIVFVYSTGGLGFEEKLAGINPSITVVRVDPGAKVDGNLMVNEWKKMGYILDKKDEVEEFTDWYEGYLDEIKSRTEGLSDEDKQHVYTAFSWSGSDRILGKNCYLGYACAMAGGINIATFDISYPTTADTEWVIDQNPDFIVLATLTREAANGYEADDPTEMKEFREKFMSRPAWENVNAVKDGRVNIVAWHTLGGPHLLFATAYMAKWFYPDLFEDLDPEAIHQEYLDRFQKLDYDLNEHGIFAYPPIEIDGCLAGIPDRYKGQI